MSVSKEAISRAIRDPGVTEGYKGDRTRSEWQTDAVMRVLSTLPVAVEVKAHDELLSLVPDEIDIPPMTDRGVAGQVLDVAWPLCGGNHQDADFWSIFSFAVNLTLRISSPGKDGGQEVER